MDQRYSFQGKTSASIHKLTADGRLSDLAIDQFSLQEYLKFGYIHPPNTIFKNVKRADVMDALPEAVADENLGPQDAKRLTRDCLKDILSKKLSGRDHPAGLFLSSGLDSCAIACASEHSLLTYTIGFTFRDWNETKIAEAVSAAAGHQHRNILLSIEDLHDHFDAWVQSLSQPYAHPNALPTWIAMKHIQEDTDLILDGSGADDVMGDVGRIESPNASAGENNASHHKGWLLQSFSAALYNIAPDWMANRIFEKTIPLSDQITYFNHWKGCLFPYLYGREIILRPELETLMRNLNSFTNYDFFLYHRIWAREAAIGRVSIASDATGLTYFMPLATQEYSDLMLRFPPVALFENGTPKHMLMEMIREKLPSYQYEKRAIQTPWTAALRDPIWTARLHALPEQLPGFQPERIRRIIRQYLDGAVDHSQRILSLLILTRWLEVNSLAMPDLQITE